MQQPSHPEGHFDEQRHAEFLRLFGQLHKNLFMFVMTLVHNREAADDILQESAMVIWREFDKFELGTDFRKWAFSIAYHQVLAWRARRKRDRLVFSEEFLAAIQSDLAQHENWLALRAESLAECLQKLPGHQRTLVELRYREGNSIEQLAEQLSRNADAIYRMLSRIRYALYDCITLNIKRRLA